MGKPSNIPLIPFYKVPLHAIRIFKNPIKEFTRMSQTYGDIFALGNANFFSRKENKPILFVNNPTWVKHIFKDNQQNYSRGEVFKTRKDLSIIEDFLGNGIFMSDGIDWEEQHKMIKQIFTPEVLQQTNTIIENETNKLINDWTIHSSGKKAIDIETPIHHMMLKILFKAQMVQNEEYDTSKIFDAFQRVMKFTSFRKSILHFFKTSLLAVIGISYKPVKHKKAIKALEVLVDELIVGLQNGKYKQGSLTQMLITKYQQNNIAYKDVRDTIMNFIFAGFETTAAALTWTLYSLAKHPNEQTNVQQEIDESVKTGDNQYNYLKMVTKEAMRFYPPVWFYLRECLQQDATIEPYTIRKGAVVMFCPFALHQHPQFWDNPKAFNPQNFEKQAAAGKSFVYIPFGQGKRTCIGQAFANMQLNTILVQLLSKFSFGLASAKHPTINPAIIIKGAKPVQLVINTRH